METLKQLETAEYGKVESYFIEIAELLTERFNINKADLKDIIDDNITE